ncbi:MAG: hypothetical protein J7L43_01265 [Candidatus Aenigmarchaeota archaeon]|nr:hypothetical protein [Candidatus Aenigmarchaeota archaeon]
MFGTGIDVAIGVLIALVFIHYIALDKKIKKAFTWMTAGAISFVLAGVFEKTPFVAEYVTQNGINYGLGLFAVIGWILVLVGSLWTMYQLIAE